MHILELFLLAIMGLIGLYLLFGFCYLTYLLIDIFRLKLQKHRAQQKRDRYKYR